MLDETTITRYLKRIGADRPENLDIEALSHLQERHVLSVPFENLDYHLGVPIPLDESIVGKIVDDRRGGGCYETNPALGFLLRSLGFEVTIISGRVHFPDRMGPPLGHLALRVDLDRPWLVDVGLGRNSRRPLRMDTTEPQQDPHGEYRLVPAPDGGTDVLLNGKPECRLYERPCELDDFRPTLWWFRTAPESPFLRDLVCSMPTEQGRVTLKGNRLTRVVHGERHTEELPDEDTTRRAYREWFGIELDTVPRAPEQSADRNLGGALS
ncbi:arylamine N-acetyltransferase family protein [Actinopolyspora mortivallis]|uniref:arylamine N-acetyltransferase family protein n=1 Tax=Actinopolyspora mortivallis TaxID=33906 RepID=UPI00037B9EFE|nr:arylamine N-acetyltransferase [Actinopolyspora mortivallis]